MNQCELQQRIADLEEQLEDARALTGELMSRVVQLKKIGKPGGGWMTPIEYVEWLFDIGVGQRKRIGRRRADGVARDLLRGRKLEDLMWDLRDFLVERGVEVPKLKNTPDRAIRYIQSIEKRAVRS